MTYIIRHDFDISSVPYYVRLVDDKTFEEIYNPKFATQFSGKAKAKRWVDTYSPMADNSKIVETADAIEQFEKWVNSGTIRRTLSCINTSKSRPYNNESVDEVIDWWIYTTENEDEIKYEHYKTWPELYEISSHLFSIEQYHDSKDYSDISTTFQVYTGKEGKFKQFELELGKVMDKVTFKDEEGYLIFPIFDHYRSEHGNSVSLLIHPETKKVKIGGGYSWNENEFSSLKGAFEYMRRERWYE
jgi:hypothetical protein